MSKKTPISIAILKKIALTPIYAGLIYFVCVESVAQEKNSIDKVSDIPVKSYFSGVRFIYREGINKELKINKLYEDLTDNEKNKLKLILKIGKQNPLKRKSPTKKEFDDFKDSKKYAIWINDVPVSNISLNNYNTNDIAVFGGSVVLKNARSKKFPQPFQYWFFTQKYYDDKKMGEQAKKYPNDTIEIWHKKMDKISTDKIQVYNSISKNEKQPQEKLRAEEVSNPKTNDGPQSKTLEDITKPSFPGGMVMFYKYVSNNFKIPENFNGSGKIYLKFIVEKDGGISEIEIIKDLGFGLGAEATRVLKESPKWIPGQLNGKPARMIYSMPIMINSNL